jgi:hypothetical protein
MKFPSPLHVIKYIKQHDLNMKRRLMEELKIEEYMLSCLYVRIAGEGFVIALLLSFRFFASFDLLSQSFD